MRSATSASLQPPPPLLLLLSGRLAAAMQCVLLPPAPAPGLPAPSAALLNPSAVPGLCIVLMQLFTSSCSMSGSNSLLSQSLRNDDSKERKRQQRAGQGMKTGKSHHRQLTSSSAGAQGTHGCRLACVSHAGSRRAFTEARGQTQGISPQCSEPRSCHPPRHPASMRRSMQEVANSRVARAIVRQLPVAAQGCHTVHAAALTRRGPPLLLQQCPLRLAGSSGGLCLGGCL